MRRSVNILRSVMHSLFRCGAAFAMLSIGIFSLAVILTIGGCRGGHDSHEPDAARKRLSEAERKREESRKWFQNGLKATDLAEKERCYIEALKLLPSYTEAHNNLGDTYEQQGRLEEALREYELAAVLAGGFAVAHFGIGDVCLKMGRFHRAVQAYERGLLLDPKDELSKRRLRVAKVLTQSIQFGFDSSRLTSQAKEQLRQMAGVLQQPEVKDMIFDIQGHADSTGPADYNMRLSLRRARAVKDFLIGICHIAKKRLVAKGYGEDRPIASNETKEGRATNRRLQLVKAEIEASMDDPRQSRLNSINGRADNDNASSVVRSNLRR